MPTIALMGRCGVAGGNGGRESAKRGEMRQCTYNIQHRMGVAQGITPRYGACVS